MGKLTNNHLGKVVPGRAEGPQACVFPFDWFTIALDQEGYLRKSAGEVGHQVPFSCERTGSVI